MLNIVLVGVLLLAGGYTLYDTGRVSIKIKVYRVLSKSLEELSSVLKEYNDSPSKSKEKKNIVVEKLSRSHMDLIDKIQDAL